VPHGQPSRAGAIPACRRRRTVRVATARALLAAILATTAPALAQIRPEPAAVAAASPALLDLVSREAYAYFRLVNRPWIDRVCQAFADVMPALPTVRLHGDAHLEQFAVTAEAWGLDDFDDSARGPAVVDVVRSLGSVDLAARQRGWLSRRDEFFDRFFDGYRQGLSNPDFPPAIAARP
jgi:Ser/Thr protein kinase RdoA (MazF antagonist)